MISSASSPEAVPSAAERSTGAVTGYVLGAGFGADADGRPLATRSADADDAVWPTRADLAGPAEALDDAARGLVAGAAAGIADPGVSYARYAVAVAVGVSTVSDPLGPLLDVCRDRLGESGRASDVAAATAAVAAAVSMCVAGSTWEEAVALAMTAADEGSRCGRYVPGPSLAARLGWAQALATRADGDPLDVLDLLVGAGPVPQETVPAAFAIVALHRDDPQRAALSARRLGGNSCAIGAVAGAVTGARAGIGVWPPELRALGGSLVDLDRLGADLASHRHRYVSTDVTSTDEERP